MIIKKCVSDICNAFLEEDQLKIIGYVVLAEHCLSILTYKLFLKL